MTGLNIHNLSPFTVGFDRIFDRLVEIENHPAQHGSQGFPPYNIRINKAEDKFTIELALAGLDESDVDIEVKENQLANPAIIIIGEVVKERVQLTSIYNELNKA